MTNEELYELALRGYEHPETLTESEIRELTMLLMEDFEPSEPSPN